MTSPKKSLRGRSAAAEALRSALRERALAYASARGLPVDASPKSAVLFRNVADNFCPASWRAIEKNPDWLARTRKRHPGAHYTETPDALEMQSSNSSDALLMSVFCHPRIASWKGVQNVLGFKPENPVFGFKARVAKSDTAGDETEIDMVVGDCFVEAKLTESDFTEKPTDEVLRYTHLADVFHVDMLPRRGESFLHYQVIRNLLAAVQHDRRHLLICDERRADLAMNYMRVVSCLKKMQRRRDCDVVFWQQLFGSAGIDLREYGEDRYLLAP